MADIFRNLKKQIAGKQLKVSIKTDEKGFIGRECPEQNCESYFRVKPGTGLPYKTETCFCPYCGHQAPHNHFYTKDQNEYAKSVARKYIADSFHNELKKLETKNNSGARNVIGISVEVKRGRAPQIYTYIEHKLETDIICNNCSLEYSIYGKFAFCPDCGEHNSLQILIKNFEMIDKLLAIAMEQSDKDIVKVLTEDALEDCISTFDGYGKEICHVNGGKSNNHTRANGVSFQNIQNAAKAIEELFGFDIHTLVTPAEWDFVAVGFQKRHLLAHKMGVVDNEYLRKSSDSSAVSGRIVEISQDDVVRTRAILEKIAQGLSEFLK